MVKVGKYSSEQTCATYHSLQNRISLPQQKRLDFGDWWVKTEMRLALDGKKIKTTDLWAILQGF